MPSKLECPQCGQQAPVIWLGHRLIYRPHNDANGNRCKYRGGDRK